MQRANHETVAFLPPKSQVKQSTPCQKCSSEGAFLKFDRTGCRATTGKALLFAATTFAFGGNGTLSRALSGDPRKSAELCRGRQALRHLGLRLFGA